MCVWVWLCYAFFLNELEFYVGVVVMVGSCFVSQCSCVEYVHGSILDCAASLSVKHACKSLSFEWHIYFAIIVSITPAQPFLLSRSTTAIDLRSLIAHQQFAVYVFDWNIFSWRCAICLFHMFPPSSSFDDGMHLISQTNRKVLGLNNN